MPWKHSAAHTAEVWLQLMATYSLSFFPLLALHSCVPLSVCIAACLQPHLLPCFARCSACGSFQLWDPGCEGSTGGWAWAADHSESWAQTVEQSQQQKPVGVLLLAFVPLIWLVSLIVLLVCLFFFSFFLSVVVGCLLSCQVLSSVFVFCSSFHIC